MATEGGRAAARYLQLVRELAKEVGGNRWRSEVARRLGVDPSYIKRLGDDERTSVGLDAVERAISRMKLHPSFFFGPRRPDSYQSYRAKVAPEQPAWREFLETPDAKAALDSPNGRQLIERLATMAAAIDDMEPSVRLYKILLLNLQSEIDSGLMRAVALEQALDKEMGDEE